MVGKTPKNSFIYIHRYRLTILSLSLTLQIKVVPLFFRESDCDLKEEELDLIMSMLDSFFSKGFKAAKWSVFLYLLIVIIIIIMYFSFLIDFVNYLYIFF